MTLHQEALSETNLGDVYEFIRFANPFSQHTWGWDTGRFVDWRWAGNTLREAENPGWFSRHCLVVREDSAIRAIQIAEYGERDTCILTNEEAPELVRELLGPLVQDRESRGIGLNLDLLVPGGWLRPILVEFGFSEEPDTGHEWEYDLNRVATISRVPDGFTIGTLTSDRNRDYAGIADCIRAAFETDYDAAATLRSLEASPMFRPGLSVFARSPEGRIAAYCRGTVDPDNGICGIDPVCTHPDFRQLGLARAVVETCFLAQSELGGRFSYIGSAAEPAPSTFLYRALRPSHRADYSSWSKAPTVMRSA